MAKVAVIGAGIAGLTVASELKNYANVTVFEKSRGVGGRMSTRRVDGLTFDHGAQYMTAKTPQFKQFMDRLVSTGVVAPWMPKVASLSPQQGIEFCDIDSPWYVGVPGMNAVAKYLAQGCNLRVNTRIEQLEKGQLWTLIDEQGVPQGQFDWVVISAPAPQTASLYPLDSQKQALIPTAMMTGCFTVMLAFDQPVNLPFDVARISGSSLGWMAVNSSKPGRQGATLVIQSTNHWADLNAERDRADVLSELRAEAENLLDQKFPPLSYESIHFWRYANVITPVQIQDLVDESLRVAACGDWCQEGRVEGAYLSALNTVNRLKSYL